MLVDSDDGVIADISTDSRFAWWLGKLNTVHKSVLLAGGAIKQQVVAQEWQLATEQLELQRCQKTCFQHLWLVGEHV